MAATLATLAAAAALLLTGCADQGPDIQGADTQALTQDWCAEIADLNAAGSSEHPFALLGRIGDDPDLHDRVAAAAPRSCNEDFASIRTRWCTEDDGTTAYRCREMNAPFGH